MNRRTAMNKECCARKIAEYNDQSCAYRIRSWADSNGLLRRLSNLLRIFFFFFFRTYNSALWEQVIGTQAYDNAFRMACSLADKVERSAMVEVQVSMIIVTFTKRFAKLLRIGKKRIISSPNVRNSESREPCPDVSPTRTYNALNSQWMKVRQPANNFSGVSSKEFAK